MRPVVLAAMLLVVSAMGGCTRENGLAFDPKADNQHKPPEVGTAARAMYGDQPPKTEPAVVDAAGRAVQSPAGGQ